MSRFATIAEATEAIRTFTPKGGLEDHYTLDRMRKLMNALSNPQEQLRIIHIAGTSGKTSTAYFIRGLLEANGKRTGLTVSPHIEAINERAQIEGQPLSEPRFIAAIEEFLDLVAITRIRPSYYELMMAFAYWIFAKEKVDYAIIETGLGGLLDGSNIVRRPDKVCVITDLGLEHTEILGHTLPEIAQQKVGIVQPGNHLITHHQPPEIYTVFQYQIKTQQATSYYVDKPREFPDLAAFQARNLTLAIQTYHYLEVRDSLLPLLETTIREVMNQTPPGRFERYTIGETTVILDGAHNPQKLAALVKELQIQGLSNVPTLLGFVDISEDILANRLKAIQPIVKECYVTEFSDQQDMYKHSLSIDALSNAAQQIDIPIKQSFHDPLTALEELLRTSHKIVLITGSLYLIRQLRPRLIVLNQE